MDQAGNGSFWRKRKGLIINMRILSPDNEGMGRLARFVVTVLILAAILLTTVFFAVRTEMGRELVKEGLEKRLGMKLNVGSTRIGWPYVLVAEDVQSIKSRSGSGEKEALFEAGEIRIGLGFRPRWRLSVYKGVLNLVEDRDGNWDPEVFSRLSELPLKGVTEIAKVTEELRRNVALYLSECSINWLNSDGNAGASAKGISFHLRPVKLSQRRMYHYDISIYNLVYTDNTRDHDIEREWLSSDTVDYVEIYSAGRTTSRAGVEFWGGQRPDSMIRGWGLRDDR